MERTSRRLASEEMPAHADRPTACRAGGPEGPSARTKKKWAVLAKEGWGSIGVSKDGQAVGLETWSRASLRQRAEAEGSHSKPSDCRAVLPGGESGGAQQK